MATAVNILIANQANNENKHKMKHGAQQPSRKINIKASGGVALRLASKQRQA